MRQTNRTHTRTSSNNGAVGVGAALIAAGVAIAAAAPRGAGVLGALTVGVGAALTLAHIRQDRRDPEDLARAHAQGYRTALDHVRRGVLD